MQPVKIVFSGLLGLSALGMLAFGPRPGSDQPKNRVVVSYWEKWTSKESEQMKEIVNDFNNTIGKEKGIYVDYLSMSSINQKTLVATAAGVPPDVAGVWEAQIPQFAAINALESLSEMARAKGISKEYYKPVYWETCSYQGQLYGMVSTPASVALHYNKKVFQDAAPELRKAGLDPNRAPKTLAEMDAYAKAIDKFDNNRLVRSGYLPMEPGWWLMQTANWFGGQLFDQKTQKFTLTDPKVVKGYEWIASYSKKLGKDSLSEFRSTVGGFDSPQNPFIMGTVAMEQQGPWMSNYIDKLAPKLNRVLTSDKKLEMTWSTEKRRANYAWGAAAFPAVTPDLDGATNCVADVLVIPRGAKHPKEAFEFIAYVNSQKAMEKLCMMHCKNSPLAKVSDTFLKQHPNPYIQVFEDLASNPKAFTIPRIGIWPEVNAEMDVVAQKVYLLQDTPENALAEAQVALQGKYDRFRAFQEGRAKTG